MTFDATVVIGLTFDLLLKFDLNILCFASSKHGRIKANVSQENPVLRHGLRHFSNVLLCVLKQKI